MRYRRCALTSLRKAASGPAILGRACWSPRRLSCFRTCYRATSAGLTCSGNEKEYARLLIRGQVGMHEIGACDQPLRAALLQLLGSVFMHGRISARIHHHFRSGRGIRYRSAFRLTIELMLMRQGFARVVAVCRPACCAPQVRKPDRPADQLGGAVADSAACVHHGHSLDVHVRAQAGWVCVDRLRTVNGRSVEQFLAHLAAACARDPGLSELGPPLFAVLRGPT